MRTSWHIRIKLLGFPSVVVHGRPLDLRSNKAIAILAYLALRRSPVLRCHLDTLLWPESDRHRARRSLREELSLLRHHVPAGALMMKGQSVALASSTVVDVWAFEDALSHGDFEGATTQYSGDLLEGINVRNAVGFEEWLEQERQVLQDEYVEALQNLCMKAVEADEFGAALAYNQQIIATNPFNEAPYLRGMQWASQIGETARALDLYHDLQLVMKREFGITPSAAAVSLAREIATGGNVARTRLAMVDSVNAARVGK